MKIFRFLLMTAAVVAVVSCGTQKKIADGNVTDKPSVTTETDNSNWLGQMLSTVGGWNTMKSNGHFSIKGGGKSFSSGMQVRMVRDQVIYISIRPLLGIEAGRLIIKDDSLFVINKLQKLYLAEKVSLLTADVPATVGMMQDLFLGRPHIVSEGTLNTTRKELVKVIDDGEKYHVTPINKPMDFSYEFMYDKNSNIVSLNVKLDKGSDAYNLSYNNVQRTLAGNIAHGVNFTTDVKGKTVGLEFDYDRITWNEEVETSFSIPASYKRQDARSILGMFQ